MAGPSKLISVVLPLYNEAGVLGTLYQSVIENLDRTGCHIEVIFVNDGSSDGSDVICDEIAAADGRVVVLHLSRNFGHQAAVHAGLARARGDAVIVMDSDLQDDPGSLPEFVAQWEAGFDVVYAVRAKRKENVAKRALFFAFYRVLNAISKSPIPMDAGIFGLVDRKVVNNILQMKEQDRFYPGLRHWVGFRQTGVTVERAARYDDHPRVSMLGLFRLAKTALFSFSNAPLALFYCFSVLSMIVCGTFTCFTLYHKLITGLATPGWTSMIIIASFFGALNALGIGILGEYVFRIYDEVRGRPNFIVAREVHNLPADRDSSLERHLVDELESLTRELADLNRRPQAIVGDDSTIPTSCVPTHI